MVVDPTRDVGPRDPTFAELRTLFQIVAPPGEARPSLASLLRRVEDMQGQLEPLTRFWPLVKGKGKGKGVRSVVEAILTKVLPQFSDKPSEAIEPARWVRSVRPCTPVLHQIHLFDAMRR